ncbi:TFIIH/NER complex subunit, partial [Ascosphaera pollenicola]
AEEIARLRRTLEQERILQHKKVLHKDPTLSGMQPDPTSTGGLKPALKRKKSDVSRTGASADGTIRLTEPDEPTGPLPANKGADAENANRGTVNEQTKNDAVQNDIFKIPKPIPVSDRVAEGNPSLSKDSTQRPAQQPALALATVLKNLEDEVNDLKTQLEKNQNALKAHDASLGKRQRKSLVRTIEVLLHDVDTKSDQIYALYDVLEGQKAAGAEMTQDEVEITMRDIIGEGAGKDKGKDRANDDDDDEGESEVYAEDSVQEWNGFESSEEMPRSASRKKNSRVSL